MYLGLHVYTFILNKLFFINTNYFFKQKSNFEIIQVLIFLQHSTCITNDLLMTDQMIGIF